MDTAIVFVGGGISIFIVILLFSLLSCAMDDVEQVVINEDVVSKQEKPLYVYKKKEKTA